MSNSDRAKLIRQMLRAGVLDRDDAAKYLWKLGETLLSEVYGDEDARAEIKRYLGLPPFTVEGVDC